MSGSITPSIPALPSAIENAQSLLAAMMARTSVITDLNAGSIIRTIAESNGAVVEEQGAEISALVYQAIIYGAYSAFGIFPLSGTSATGQVTFATMFGVSPPPATQNIPIPSGTIVQTPAGVQFQTLSNSVLASGATSVTVGVIAIIPGAGGNVGASAVSQIINNISYPLFIANPAPTSGGSNSELLSQTATRFAAAVTLPGLCSPLAIANAAIGVSAITGESVLYSTVYEPWILGGSAANNLGFILYIDNGTGSASTQLISTVTTFINSPPQYRDAGVPWSVQAANPVTAAVAVTGVLNSQYAGQLSTVSGAMASGITNYFASLQFDQLAEQPQIAAAIGNSVPGVLNSLAVTLNGGVSAVASSTSGRVILSSLAIGLS